MAVGSAGINSTRQGLVGIAFRQCLPSATCWLVQQPPLCKTVRMSTADQRLQAAISHARRLVSEARQEQLTAELELNTRAITACVRPGETFRQPPPPRRGTPIDSIGWIVATTDRSFPATSIKPANAVRAPSRIFHVAALFGILNATLAEDMPSLRAINIMVGFGFAAYSLAQTNVGYSEACLLDKAWKMAGDRSPRHFTSDEILNARHDIAREYEAPKCAGDTEIYDALRNLVGLKAIRQIGSAYLLKEHVTIFRDGKIME